ncbi:MAG: hypothetical protein GY859_07095 [Desulfobacterales bacterium]|nr:hypothetical protein [Desulfobacterales bacterium]
MKWSEIRKLHPDKFILIGDIIEEKISNARSQILEASILEISDSGAEIMRAYKEYKRKGFEVLFTLPTTPEEFIVKNVPLKGILT